jgi:hypothetical protein
VHNTFQGNVFGAGREVRSEKPVVMRVRQRRIFWVRCSVHLV